MTLTPAATSQSESFMICRNTAFVRLNLSPVPAVSVLTSPANHSSVSPAIDILYKATLGEFLTSVVPWSWKVAISGARKTTPSNIFDSSTESPSQVKIRILSGVKTVSGEPWRAVPLGIDLTKA